MSEYKPKNKGHRFAPGQSGNPNGRPKSGETWAEILTRIGATKTGKGKNVRTRKEAVAETMYRLAAEGDVRAVNWIANREEGLPAQTVNSNLQGRLVLEYEGPLHDAVNGVREHARNGKRAD